MSFNFTENNIADLIVKNQNKICTAYDCLIPKCYTTHDNECDILGIRKSGFCDEFEIKVSRCDFLNDAKKKIQVREFKYDSSNPHTDDMKHHKMQFDIGRDKWKKLTAPWEKLKYTALIDGDTNINYFWYVIKDGIVSNGEIPHWAGVIRVLDTGRLKIDRQPKKLSKEKSSFEFRFKMIRKMGFRYWEQRLK